MLNVCILGGSGFVGNRLAGHLAAAGHYLTIPTRHYQRTRNLLVLPNIRIIECDIHDPAQLEEICRGQDALINLVGILHGSRTEFERAHVALPEKTIAACRATGVVRLLHMSALGADSGSRSVYQQTKAEGEKRVLAAFGLDVTVFRPSIIFGPGDSFLNLFADLLKRAPAIPLANARSRFQPVHVDDVARAFSQAIGMPETFGRSYSLCGPKAYRLEELIRIVADKLGLQRKVIPLGTGLSYLLARLMELKPGKKLMTRDNHYAMQSDNVCPNGFPSLFGQPAALEAHIDYLLPGNGKARYDRYRKASGR